VAPPTVQIPELRSLTWATEVDGLPLDTLFQRREDHLVIRSPENPGHYWGNLLIFDDAPSAGDGARWEQLFDAEFADEPRVRHRTFTWDRGDGAQGAAHAEFEARGYDIQQMVGMVASAQEVRAHPRASREVLVRALDARPGGDQQLWEQVVEIQVAGRDDRISEQALREHRRKRHEELRALFRARGGGWYVALDPSGREVLASCCMVMNGPRASVHDVDTAEPHRRRGICSRLVVEAVHEVARLGAVERFVIAADPDYHALGLYESLGFRATERCAGVCRMPSSQES
jgi:ribosomal protein S18 acetylase RimI-like enzyme